MNKFDRGTLRFGSKNFDAFRKMLIQGKIKAATSTIKIAEAEIRKYGKLSTEAEQRKYSQTLEGEMPSSISREYYEEAKKELILAEKELRELEKEAKQNGFLTKEQIIYGDPAE